MAASLSVRVYTGAGKTQSTAVTGLDLISADNATNSLANRQANPVAVGTQSFEKWINLVVDVAPANGVTNFLIWGGGVTQTSTSLFFTANYVTYSQPTNAVSAVANANFNSYTSGNKATWDTASYSATGASTKFAVFQLAIGADCGPGNWTQQTANYSYDET
jgi:hypothetical protein